jgi:hypothetical protein
MWRGNYVSALRNVALDATNFLDVEVNPLAVTQLEQEEVVWVADMALETDDC